MVSVPPSSVDLVIFDCDGVLIDSEVISTRSTVEALSALGYVISEANVARRFVGRSYASIRKEIEADWGRSLPTTFEADVEKRTLNAMVTSLQPTKGVQDALPRLELPRCVASSSSVDWIATGLEKTGLLQHFEPHLFSASMVANGKPAPDIFLFAAERMGVAANKALVIEDSLPGAQAGLAAGMTVLGFTGGSHIIDPAEHAAELTSLGVHGIIDDMRALPDLVAG